MDCFRSFCRKKSNCSKGTNDSKNRQGGGSDVPGASTLFKVTVPDDCKPGEEFQVFARNRIVWVRCPLDSRPGQLLHITVPLKISLKKDYQKILGSNPPAYMVVIPEGTGPGERFNLTIGGQDLTVTCPQNARVGMQVRIVPPMETDFDARPDDVNKIEGSDPPAYMVKVPEATGPGEQFYVQVGGQLLRVTCLQKARSGMFLRIIPPPMATQLWEVSVPEGVTPGSRFALTAGGMRVFVKCPPNAGPGQRIRFKLPLEPGLIKRKQTQTNLLARMKLLAHKIRRQTQSSMKRLVHRLRSLFSRRRISKKYEGNKPRQGMQSEEMTMDTTISLD